MVPTCWIACKYSFLAGSKKCKDLGSFGSPFDRVKSTATARLISHPPKT